MHCADSRARGQGIKWWVLERSALDVGMRWRGGGWGLRVGDGGWGEIKSEGNKGKRSGRG